MDAVVEVFAAAQAVQFVKQYAEQGIKVRLPLLGAGVSTDESALPAIGEDAVGVVTALAWAPTLQTPGNQAFMKLAEAKLKRTLDSFHAVMYSAGRWITAAAEARIVPGLVANPTYYAQGLASKGMGLRMRRSASSLARHSAP